jgi:5-methylcytosine-specific restriction protein A
MARLQSLKPRVAIASNRLSTIAEPTWRTGMTSAERGYDNKWRKARALYLQQHPLCVMCQADGIVGMATVVDHIVPHRGNQSLFWNPANWQSLCATHHSRDKQRIEQNTRGEGV